MSWAAQDLVSTTSWHLSQCLTFTALSCISQVYFSTLDWLKNPLHNIHLIFESLEWLRIVSPEIFLLFFVNSTIYFVVTSTQVILTTNRSFPVIFFDEFIVSLSGLISIWISLYKSLLISSLMSAPNQPSVGKNSSTTSEVSLANSSEIDCLGEEGIESDYKSLQKKFNIHFWALFWNLNYVKWKVEITV